MATTTRTTLPTDAWVAVDTLTAASSVSFLQPTEAVVYRVDPPGAALPALSEGGFAWSPENEPIRLGGGGLALKVRALGTVRL